MIIRNSVYNFLGMGMPTGVAFLSIPVLIEELGAEKFGILTLIWAVVSYFGLFDLGLGRAVTQQVAVFHRDDPARLRDVLATSNFLLTFFGVLGGLCLAAAAVPIAGSFLVVAGDGEVFRSILWVAAAMPFVVLTSGHRGALEGLERFGIVNALRVPMGTYTFAAPLVVVMLGHPQLDMIAASLFFGRVVGWAAHALFAERAFAGAARFGLASRERASELLRLGGGMSVSNIVAPFMNYLDRFILAGVGSFSAVAYYATPQELVTRLGIIPSALSTALFPRFASSAAGNGPATDHKRLQMIMVALTAPLALVLLVAAHPILQLWIGNEFANHAAAPLQILALGIVPSALAQVPFAAIQARGRSDVTAKLHFVELPVYVMMIWALASQFGAVGAATAWLIRVVADAAILLWLEHKVK